MVSTHARGFGGLGSPDPSFERSEQSRARDGDRSRVGFDGGSVGDGSTRSGSRHEATERTDTTVLVVDDEAGFADAVALWLRGDYDVRVAYDGDEALDEYGPDVDVVLLDRRMPAVSGDEVLERIRERDGDARVALLTASELALDAADLPFDRYLQKPVDEDEVVDAVETLERWNAYPDPLREYLAVAARLAELSRTHASRDLDDHDQYDALESRLDDLRPRARDAITSLSADERRSVREFVDSLAYPASLFD